jgi:type II secretory pathway pseudopilin PulG
MRGKISKRPPTSQQTGFTLLEVMVAAGIGTAVLLVMLATMVAGTKGYGAATRRIDALVEARAALGVISDDVATMIPHGREAFGWAAEDERFQEIWFLTRKPEDAQAPEQNQGDVCFVHYYTAVTADSFVAEVPVSRKLYRQFLSSGEIAESLQKAILPEPQADSGKGELIAFNVTKFVVQPLESGEDGSGMREWTSDEGIPDSLRIDFQVVDNDTAELFQNEEDWNLQSKLARKLVLEGESGASARGRDFEMNLTIGHAN